MVLCMYTWSGADRRNDASATTAEHVHHRRRARAATATWPTSGRAVAAAAVRAAIATSAAVATTAAASAAAAAPATQRLLPRPRCRELVEVLPTACDDERTRARCMLSCQTCPPPSAPPPSPAPPIEEVNGCYPPECIPRTHTCRDPALIVCSDDCKYAKDVACDDGAQDDGGVSDLLKKDQYCEWGTACTDCGPRCCEDDMDWLGMSKIAGDSPPLTPSVTTFNPPVSPT